jgi:NADH-quinone oxidoreductase subunit K
VIGLHHYLIISAMLFVLSIAGIVLNRRNLILMLMCIELMLLAVNFNFVAFSRYLGDDTGQVFVFFILTVAAAEAAIGLAILVVLFRNRRSIDVQELKKNIKSIGIARIFIFFIVLLFWNSSSLFFEINLNNHAEPLILPLSIRFRIITIRAMSTATLTAIASFKMILFCKNTIPFFRPVKIPFFNRNDFFH